MRILIIIIIMYSLIGCDPHDGKLTLVNNTNDTIYYNVAYCDENFISYPIYEKGGKIDYLYSNILITKEEQHIPLMDTWEYFINDRCKDSMIKIFFFTKNLIKNTSRDSMMRFQLYSKKFRLKVKDLEKTNWKVSYQ